MKNKPSFTEDAIGWIGALLLMLAYSLNALEFIVATHPLYIFFNLFGALSVGYIAYRYRNYQSALINFIWLIVAIIALTNLIRTIL